MAGSFVWPVYFATQALHARRVTLREGDPFPLQSKDYIRGLGAAYGLRNAEATPFAKLPYVAMLDVRSEEMARTIVERGLRYSQAKKLIEGGAAHA